MAVFKGKVWLTGGKSASYTMYNQVNKQAVRNEDVWTYTHGASTWQQSQLTGDFAAQNWDYLDGGNQAPWYSRFGHSLTPFDLDGDGEADLLVLIGGFSPDPSNDVWASLDGEKWVFVEHAPFHGRAWHGAVQHEGRLVVVGGTPLNNEVWITDTITMTGDYNTSTFHTNWYRADAGDLGWMPRAGFGLVPQNRTGRVNGTTPTGEALYLLGGYGGWPASSKRYDGVRCRNDVWRSYDAVTWEKVTDSAGWGARAWMGAVAFHQLGATDRDVASDRRPPRLWVAGGGYMGTMANNIVRAMEAYADLWWSYDGDSWVQVSMTEGSGSNLYSTEEWALTTVDDVSIYIGKWGMQLVNFKRVYTETSEDGTTTSTTLPAMLLAGGDYADSGTQDSTVFVSGGGVLCSYKGVECNEHGTCDEGQGGCTCEEGYLGAFCTETDPDYTAAAPRRRPRWGGWWCLWRRRPGVGRRPGRSCLNCCGSGGS